MMIQLEHGSKTYKSDLSKPIDLSISINKTENVNCYYLDEPVFSYFESESFSGNLDKGGSVNCEKVSYYAHASGTHTECALHVLPADFDMRSVQVPVLQMCRLVSVHPEIKGADKVITNGAIGPIVNADKFTAIIIRTLPNPDTKKRTNYSNSNPVYFDPELMLQLKNKGYKHLVTDLPSVDKESDGGRLQAHKNWFLSDGKPAIERTITELVYIPESVKDGVYMLAMQMAEIETDAVPSKILLFPCI